MNLSELKILVEAGHVVDITLSGRKALKEYEYTIYVRTHSEKLNGALKTGRTHSIKTYSSVDRAIQAMMSLGYKGEFKVVYSEDGE